MDRRLFIGLAALGAGAGLAGPALADTTQTAVEPGDMVMGSPKAKITVIEYASASCPHCARFNNEEFPAFKAKYIDTGRVFYVFREFLTPPTSFAAASFLLARCAGKNRYFSVVDAIFRAQTEIYESQELRGHLLKIAAGAGLDEKAVDACLADKAAIQALNDRVDRYVTRDGVNSTPTFLIGGQRLSGEQTLATLDAAITGASPKPAPAVRPQRRRPHK
jgi:protein-disulfide isomerase